MIRHSVGLPLWKNLFVTYDNGTSKDILQDGTVSCAYFVSCILKTFNLTSATFANVSSLEKSLLEYGRKTIQADTPSDQIIPGSIIVRDEKTGNEKKDIYGNKRSGHAHIGFYIGDDQAISNMSDAFDVDALPAKSPQQHHYTYNGTRAIKYILYFNFHMSLAEHFAQDKPTMLFNKQLEIPFIGQTAERLSRPEYGLTQEEIDRGLGKEADLKNGRLCGLSCLLMANNYLCDSKKTYRDCIHYRDQKHSDNLLYRSNQAGRYHGGLLEIAKTWGLDGKVLNLHYEDSIGFKTLLADCIDNKKALICSVSAEFNTEKRGGHLVVIRGYNRNGYQEELIINDPLDPKAAEGFPGAPISIPLNHFLQCRSGKYIIKMNQQ